MIGYQRPEFICLAERRYEAAVKALSSFMDLILLGGATPWDKTLDDLKAIVLEEEQTLNDAKKLLAEKE